MSVFTNVTVPTKANIYFDGKVSSRTVIFADGSKKTLGVMLPGEYTFNTEAAERMEFQAGALTVVIAGGEPVAVGAGEAFDVPANSSFTMTVTEVSDYICSFLA